MQEVILPWFSSSTAPSDDADDDDENRTLSGSFSLALGFPDGLTTSGQTSVNISANASAVEFSDALGALSFPGGPPDVERVPYTLNPGS